MEIHIEYGSDNVLNQEVIEKIRAVARPYGNLTERKWGARAGAIDLITILEIVSVFAGTKILEGFVEGFVGKKFFEDLGKKMRLGTMRQAEELRRFFMKLYNEVVSENRDRYGAIAIVEYIDRIPIYVVINHQRMSPILISRLPEAIALAIVIVTNLNFENDPLHVAQLYPNYENESWDFIFMPTSNGFGESVDRYFDIRDMRLHLLSSPEEFLLKFRPDDKDSFKIIISPRREFDRTKFDEL